MKFRVVEFVGESGDPLWMMSRSGARVLPVDRLTLTSDVIELAKRPDLEGIILLAGGFGAGKTTAVSSLVHHRIATLGGVGMVFEDPGPELAMDGRVGEGRIIQVPVSTAEGGYQWALHLAKRSRAQLAMVGEIRGGDEAAGVLDIGNADIPVMSTIHSNSIEAALVKFRNYCLGPNTTAEQVHHYMEMAIVAVVHLTRQVIPNPAGGFRVDFVPRTLLLDKRDPGSYSPRAKIRDGRFGDLQDDIAAQAARRNLSGHIARH
ncbi:ATPase, T2SS/T4P/T4SS family [uncultured Pigmentiphaga sp.]|uniref:ATPase, T2SS/T4P/T4SS family n=1 Tax=uncultured Pigmentiphaga sp. TaxID=340361 RepID=UPI0026230AA2|nr:ATPase, T2SS/T4P/T4SS family [uncultured Pigmentiphaga sp.]